MRKNQVFISYAHRDIRWAEWLGEKLSKHGLSLAGTIAGVSDFPGTPRRDIDPAVIRDQIERLTVQVARLMDSPGSWKRA